MQFKYTKRSIYSPGGQCNGFILFVVLLCVHTNERDERLNVSGHRENRTRDL